MLCNLFAEKQINRNIKNFRELNKHIKVGLAAALSQKLTVRLHTPTRSPNAR